MNYSKKIILIALSGMSFLSCQKNEEVSNTSLASKIEFTGEHRRDLDFSNLSYLRSESIPKEFLRKDGLRSFKYREYDEYDFTKVSGAKDPKTGNIAYVVPKKSEVNSFLLVAYNEDFGITSVSKMIYRKENQNSLYTVNLFDEKDTPLFSFKTDLKSYKVLNSNTEYNSFRGAYAWACGMSMAYVGGMWGTVVGMVNPIAGFAVGMGFSALSIWMCDEKKKEEEKDKKKKGSYSESDGENSATTEVLNPGVNDTGITFPIGMTTSPSN